MLRINPPQLMFSHCGLYCTEIGRLEDFYTRVLGFAISDRGTGGSGAPMTFMTRRPREHHQLVLAGGRPAEAPTTVAQIGFKAPSLAELRRIRDLLAREPGASDVVAVDHGISWSLYFRDPEGIRCMVSVDSDWHVPQPAAWPLELDRSDAEIKAATERRWCAVASTIPRRDWQETKRQEYAAAGRLTAETEPTGDPEPDFAPPIEPGRRLVWTDAAGEDRAEDLPRIAMSHVGIYALDPYALAEFYANVLGYAVSGVGRMDAIGAEPARDMVYLTRDPAEHHQLVMSSGRARETPTSVNQISLRVTSLAELRRIEELLTETPGASDLRYVNHGNSFSIYFSDPEDNRIELAVETVWYVPAPSGWRLDLSLDDDQLIGATEARCRATPGFAMRADWKAVARRQLAELGRLEAEGLVSHVA